MTGIPRKRVEYESDSKVLYDIREQLANSNKLLREILEVLDDIREQLANSNKLLREILEVLRLRYK